MIAVIFEAQPHPRARPDYLDAAERLRPLLAQIDGFVSIERFESLSRPGKLLSLSYWRDEDAVRQWRYAPTGVAVPITLTVTLQFSIGA